MPTTEQYLGPNNKRARNDGLPAVVVAMPRTGSTTRLTSSREVFKTQRNGPAIVLKGIAVAPLLYARETQCTPRAFANDQRKRSLPWLLGDASAPPDGACVLETTPVSPSVTGHSMNAWLLPLLPSKKALHCVARTGQWVGFPRRLDLLVGKQPCRLKLAWLAGWPAASRCCFSRTLAHPSPQVAGSDNVSFLSVFLCFLALDRSQPNVNRGGCARVVRRNSRRRGRRRPAIARWCFVTSTPIVAIAKSGMPLRASAASLRCNRTCAPRALSTASERSRQRRL